VQATSSFQRRSGTSHANRAPPITAPTPCAATWRVVGDLAARIERDLAALLEHPAQLLAPALHARLHARATLPELRQDWRTVAIRSIAVDDEVKALLSANDLPIDDLDRFDSTALSTAAVWSASSGSGRSRSHRCSAIAALLTAA
jgi:hypothetical protein